MSVMAKITPLVTTVTKPATNPKDADATPRINIQEFCEEYYNDIFPIIMDKVCRDRRKDVHTSKTYSPSTTKSRPRRIDSRDRSQGRSRPHRLDTSNEDCPKDRKRFRSVGESYDDFFSHSYRDGNRSRHMKRRRDNESPLSSVSKSDSSDGRGLCQKFPGGSTCGTVGDAYMVSYVQLNPNKGARVWFDELRPESIDSYKDLKAAFLAYFMQQKKYVKDPVEIHNIKQKDGETIEDFMERLKVETGRMKGSPECMQIFGFMRGVNNLELTKRLNEHVSKKMKEMMITTTAFIRREAAAASKKKGHTSWKAHDQFKRKTSNKRSDFWVTQGKERDLTGSLPLQGRQNRFLWPGQNGKKKVTQTFERVKEITFPPLTGSSGTEGPLVIEAKMGGHMIHRMFVDDDSSMEILYEHCFNRVRPDIKSQMVLTTTSLTSFSGETIWPLGQLKLLVIIGDTDYSTRSWMNFMIVRSLSPYSGIIGRPGIREIQVVPSTAHGMLKFLVEGRIVTIRSIILMPTECTLVITSLSLSKEERTRPDNFKVALHPDFPDQEVKIEGTLSEKGHIELCSILKKNLDIFAWQPSDMKGVPGSACPHDCYPLPEIDWKVESLCGYPFKCFLDAFKGYHLIQVAKSDEEKTTFHTGQGMYCYTKMPFGLKNTGATYQWLMDKAFDSQIEVYVDELVVKSYREAEMLRDIDEMFRTLRKINMKLNPKKCTFGVAEGVFLGYVVTPDGIKLCPDKTASVLQLPSSQTIKETAEAEQAFKQLKQHLSKLPLLVAHKPKEELIIYLSATYGDISAVLMTERGATHTSIYFIIPVLQGLKLNYTPMEKLVLSPVFAAKRLRRYFQAHPITVVTDQPIKQIMSRPDMILADFLIEMPDENLQAAPVAETQQEPWTLFTDDSSRVDGLSTGLILTNLEGIENVCFQRGKHGQVPRQSQKLGQRIHQLFDKPSTTKQKQKSRCPDQNRVNQLRALVQTCTGRSTQRKIHKREGGVNRSKGGWTNLDDTNREYLKEGTLPSDRKKARKLRIKARQYELIEGILLQAVVPYTMVKMCWTAPGRIGMPTYRTAAVDVVNNDEELWLNLNLLEERRERAAICEAKAK
uniref:Reverse transcriptase domain-containing protein n=1 Tax=Tanacetum cinerariifolium TaxID=118510 RepID=A0A6L2L207_TANCI|nr:reverse transcriptase domain-containing protein [Tanacetum cinerariifolium]